MDSVARLVDFHLRKCVLSRGSESGGCGSAGFQLWVFSKDSVPAAASHLAVGGKSLGQSWDAAAAGPRRVCRVPRGFLLWCRRSGDPVVRGAGR